MADEPEEAPAAESSDVDNTPTPPFEGSSALSVDDLPQTGEHAPTDEPASAPEPAPENPSGYDQVDFATAPREQIEARFHRLYGQVKRQDQLIDQMVTDNRGLMERMQNWEVGQQQQGVASQMGRLQTQLQDAFDTGDSQAATAVTRQIAQLEARVTANQGQTKLAQQPQPAADTQQEHPDVSVIRDWSGQRAWSQEGHKDRTWAAFQLNELYQSPEWADRSVREKLGEVDRRYGELSGNGTAAPQRAAATQAQVLDQTGSTKRRSSGKVSLSEAEKAVSVRMFPELSRQEAYTKYATGK